MPVDVLEVTEKSMRDPVRIPVKILIPSRLAGQVPMAFYRGTLSFNMYTTTRLSPPQHQLFMV